MDVEPLDLAALVILLALVGAAVYYVTGNTQPIQPATAPATPTTVTESCAAANTTADNARCFARFAAENADLTACSQAALPDQCAGIASRNGLPCTAWKDPNACAYFAALEALDENGTTAESATQRCQPLNADYRKDQCFFEFALAFHSPRPCASILRPDLQTACLDLVKA